MKRTLPFPAYDITGHANPDGTGRHNWSQAHPSEEVVGRVRKDGRLDRRYTKVMRQAFALPEPQKVTAGEHIREAISIVLAMAVLLTWFVGAYLWIGIIWAGQS